MVLLSGNGRKEEAEEEEEARAKRDEGGWPFVPTFYLLERRRYYAIDGNATLHTCTRTKRLLEGTRKRRERERESCGMSEEGERVEGPRGGGMDFARLRARSICHVCARVTWVAVDSLAADVVEGAILILESLNANLHRHALRLLATVSKRQFLPLPHLLGCSCFSLSGNKCVALLPPIMSTERVLYAAIFIISHRNTRVEI